MIIATCTGSIYNGLVETKRIYKLTTNPRFPTNSLHLSLGKRLQFSYSDDFYVIHEDVYNPYNKKRKKYYHLLRCTRY